MAKKEVHAVEAYLKNPDLVITRVINAPREIVFRAWTDPDLMRRWWGPDGFTNPLCEIDARPGGSIRIDMQGPDGQIYPMTGEYREITEPDRVVIHTIAIEDEKGEAQLEMIVRAEIAKFENQTKLTLQAAVVKSTPAAESALAGMPIGWNQSLYRLRELAAEVKMKENTPVSPEKLSEPSDREVVMSRVFNAPRHLVYEAYTDPSIMLRWWGPKQYTTTVERMEVKEGGKMRFLQHGSDGKLYAFNGEFSEVVPGRRLAHTFEFEGMPGHIMDVTESFEEHAGRTKVTNRTVFQSMEDRDGMLEMGMEKGASESWDRLAEYLADRSANRERMVAVSRVRSRPHAQARKLHPGHGRPRI